jgi:hypothetical protein
VDITIDSMTPRTNPMAIPAPIGRIPTGIIRTIVKMDLEGMVCKGKSALSGDGEAVAVLDQKSSLIEYKFQHYRVNECN